ncbi:MAG: asparaginase [Bergeyella sp.]|nr:asparaginase [Bergeyella sp.]
MRKKVLAIYTGGTIGMEKEYTSGSLYPLDFEHILDKIPEIALLDCEVDIHSFDRPLDSSDIGPDEWKKFAHCIEENYHLYDGFLILHGTDTMSYSASALSFMLFGLKKPVIFTGSQLPVGDLRTDAKENLITSLYYACLYENGEAVIQEVAIYFEYKLFRANRTLKYSAENFDAYKSPNYPLLGSSGVNLQINKENLWRTASKDFFADLHLSTKVFFWRVLPGVSLQNLKNILVLTNTKILLLQVYGTGTLSGAKDTLTSLEKIRNSGIEIIVLSQCISGKICFGKYENSNLFNHLGAISAGDMTLESAFVKTLHLLDNPRYKEESFSDLFSKNLKGEKSP